MKILFWQHISAIKSKNLGSLLTQKPLSLTADGISSWKGSFLITCRYFITEIKGVDDL